MMRYFAMPFVALHLIAGVVAAEKPNELKVGDVAPAFELPGSDGKIYKSADFDRKKTVVIAWFPLAFTGG